MKINLLRQSIAAIFCSAMLIFAQHVIAAAGDDIENIATVEYQVANVTQTVVESSPTGNDTAGVGAGETTTVVEDQLVNFAVYTNDTAEQPAVPGSPADGTTHWTNYTIYNIDATTDLSSVGGPAATSTLASNGTITVALTADNIVGTAAGAPFGANTFDPTNDCAVYDATGAAVTSSVVLAPGDSVQVRVSCSIPSTPVNDDISSAIELTGIVTNGYDGAPVNNADNSAANTIDGVEQVYADDDKHGDALNNNVSIDYSAFIIQSALLNVTKTASVVSDPINGLDATNAKAIPGAILEYVIEVENNGDATATVVTLSDTLPADLECVTTGTGASAPAVTVASGATTSAPASCGPPVSGVCDTIPAGGVCTLTFYVEVQP